MGYIPTDETKFAPSPNLVAGSILTLAWLDAFIATAVFFLREVGNDEVGEYQQKLYHEIFMFFLPKAYEPLVGSIQDFYVNNIRKRCRYSYWIQAQIHRQEEQMKPRKQVWRSFYLRFSATFSLYHENCFVNTVPTN